MILEKYIVGKFKTNCYIIGDKKTNEVALIDAGDGYASVLSVIKEKGYKIKFLLITHGHPDHTSGITEVVNFTPIPIYINFADREFPCNFKDFLDTNTVANFTIGEHTLDILKVPGHSNGSVCYICNNIIFSGDTLFKDTIGRTDLPGGYFNKLVTSIKDELFKFNDNVRVLPGHGDETTIGHERANNPFLQ